MAHYPQNLNFDESLKVLKLAANNLQFLNTLSFALDREKIYEKGKTAAKKLLEDIEIKRDKKLGYLNYTILPVAT